MPKVGLHQLAQSGATVGQVPTWNGTEYAPADGGAGPAGKLLVPLITVVGGVPTSVFDADNQLVMTEVPA